MLVSFHSLIPLATALPVTPRTILVVDDDKDMRLYLTGCLRTMGSLRVFEAADGREALHLSRALVPDLVICDVVMSGLDGLDFCRALRSDSATLGIPVLLISGEKLNSPYGDGFLAKPFNATRLREEVERLLVSPA